jgi:hypothetical protein
LERLQFEGELANSKNGTMEQSSEDDSVEGNEFSFDEMIIDCAMKEDATKLKSLYRHIQDLGVSPHLSTLHAFIAAFTKLRCWKEMKQVNKDNYLYL